MLDERPSSPVSSPKEGPQVPPGDVEVESAAVSSITPAVVNPEVVKPLVKNDFSSGLPAEDNSTPNRTTDGFLSGLRAFLEKASGVADVIPAPLDTVVKSLADTGVGIMEMLGVR